MDKSSFFDFLKTLKEYGKIKSPDFIAYVLPLLEEAKRMHENNRVARITSMDKIEFDNHLYLQGQPEFALKNYDRLFEKVELESQVIDIKSTVTRYTDVDTGKTQYDDATIWTDESKEMVTPLYMLNYESWDYHLEHYDPLTDIFILGQILASVAFGLDFRDIDDLTQFVDNRKNLYFLNTGLHPTLLNLIYEMTHLYREDRTANLEEVITKLKHYREYNPEHYQDLTETEGFRNQNLSDRSHWIINRLKNRLFDITRRNKLLYFKENKSFLNLTVNSVPLLLDFKNIREEDIIFWNDDIKKKILKSQKLNLNRYFEFKTNHFLAPAINKIRLDARKSRNEYGYSPMRTVIAFLHWYNFKEDAHEKILSPLLLMPSEVVKKKGVKDQFSLEFTSSEAEINPILSYYLNDLYGIELPDFIDLETTTIEELVKGIQQQVANGSTGITINWINKPQIQLIHTIAKRNYNLKNKKLENRTRNLSLRSFQYSYDKEHYEPLGLQIFNKRVRPKHDYLEYIINEDLSPDGQAVADKTRTFYTAKTRGEVNPTIWEINTCNITIGNFNYRKMSLVRDYNEIINAQVEDEIFNQLFSEFPKRLDKSPTADIPLEDKYPIISSDPTQSTAIERARSGESYIIQGPPGTGKSQTITNLIADYIARGKKTLFVCEKRAALDVVFHRLKNKNLDECCCLIHDSQSDKKAFIHNLRDTYNDFIKHPMKLSKIKKQRLETIRRIHAELNKLKYYHATMKSGDITPIELYEVLHHTSKSNPAPTTVDMLDYPNYKEWKENVNFTQAWYEQINQLGIGQYISDYTLNNISEEILSQNNPKKVVLEKTNVALEALDALDEFISDYEHLFTGDMTLGDYQLQFATAEKVLSIVQAGKLAVLDDASTDHKELVAIHKKIETDFRNLQEAKAENEHWKNKFNREDTTTALLQWKKYQNSLLRFLQPSYYKLKNKIKDAYDFSAHAVSPDIMMVLEKLDREQQLIYHIQSLKNQAEREFGLADYEADYPWITDAKNESVALAKRWSSSNAQDMVQELAAFKPTFDRLNTQASQLLHATDMMTLKKAETELGQVQKALDSLSVLMPYIEKSKTLSPELRHCMFTKKWTIEQFHHHIAYKSLQDILDKERAFANTNGDALKRSATTITKLLDQYYDDNVAFIRATTRAQVVQKVKITETLASQLTDEEKAMKKTYNAARRILENEFGKKMRYKSIRELASSEASTLMNALKPVWLMSPQSLSDTMPIDPSTFDVVIYDEASQITVEEGVPALFRTEQTIIVGDEMQMPPTNFFSSNKYNDEDEEEVENRIGITLDADSLLNQGARKLSSIMLGWHYRSRHESLISFSNAAFYQRRLLTIPDNKIQQNSGDAIPPIINIHDPIDIDQVLSRSISYHYLENAIYQNRKNRDEADYIASMVCGMLKKDIQKSIGIVAFSQDQQSEIESALERLALKDTEFDKLLEEEYQREDEDQFNGLFVKNLENVQGDERDIIIMSVCYGHNAKRKMLMNFGPINRRGGEKRLNVIFSRAKQHMVVVSSILSNEIKNDYNEGANYFKRFLSYAKHISDGNLDHADLILDGLFSIEDHDSTAITNPVLLQLKEALEKKGYPMDVHIGQSYFKCDLGIKEAGGQNYRLGILLDKPDYYSNNDVIEQYCQKPAVLSAFGWKNHTVYSKDWLADPEAVIAQIERILSGKVLEEKANPLLQKLEQINQDDHYGKSNIKESKIATDTQEIAEEVATTNLSSAYQRYEFISDTSMKFWEVKVVGNAMYVRFGRIGKGAQEKMKVYDSQEKAMAEMNKRIESKTNKGYLSVDEDL